MSAREEEDLIIAQKKKEFDFIKNSGTFKRFSTKKQKEIKAQTYALPLHVYDGVKR